MSDSVEFNKALKVLREAGYTYGSTSRDAIQVAVKDDDWQAMRLRMKGQTTWTKVLMLTDWFADGMINFPEQTHIRWVQITNYLNALKRGGQLK